MYPAGVTSGVIRCGTFLPLTGLPRSCRRVSLDCIAEANPLKTSNFKTGVLFDLVDTLYQHRHGLTVTGNLTFRDLVDRERPYPAIVRRMDDMYTVLEVWGRETRQPRDLASIPGAILPDRMEGPVSPRCDSPHLPAPIANPRQSTGAGKDRQCRPRERPDFRRGRLKPATKLPSRQG